MSDFYSKQMEFIDNSNEISEIQTDNILLSIINDYLKGNYKEGVDDSLVNFIKAKGDKKNVIKFITYTLNNNPNNLSNDDLMQLSNLKMALIQNELNSIQSGIESNRNIDFEIVGGTIMVKTINLRGSKNREYQIVNEKIIDMGNNHYKILLKRERSDRTYKFEIKYNGGHGMTIYNAYGRYIGRGIIETKQKTIIKGNRYRKEIYNTPGTFTIDTKKEKIKLNIMFND